MSSHKWIGEKVAMQLLKIKLTITLQKLRDEGKIRFSHSEKKCMVCNRDSINDYLEAQAKETYNNN